MWPDMWLSKDVSAMVESVRHRCSAGLARMGQFQTQSAKVQRVRVARRQRMRRRGETVGAGRPRWTQDRRRGLSGWLVLRLAERRFCGLLFVALEERAFGTTNRRAHF